MAARPSIVGNLFRLSIAPAWLVVVACLLLALSTKATVGNHVLYDLRLPNRMIELLSIFRASGRLFWPAFYLIMLAVFAACVLAFGRRAVLVLVPVIVVQFFDLRHFHDSIQAQRKNRDATTFTDAPAWQSVAESHRNLVVQPPWQCGAHETPAGVPSFWIFGRLAERHGMTINSVYTSRSSPKQNAFFCGIQPERILDRGLASDSAYVFRNLAAPFGVDLGDHFCREQDGVVLCSLSGDRRGLDASLVRAAPVTPIGRRFAALSTDGHPLFGLGWTYSDGVGRWSTARKASLLVRVADRTKPARIVLSATSVIPATGPYQIRVTANGSAVADWTLSFGKGTEAEVTVPPELMDSEGLIGLKLHMPDALTARQIRIYREEWPIGIRVDQVLVVQ